MPSYFLLMVFGLTNIDIRKKLIEAVAFAADVGIFKKVEVKIFYSLIQKG